MSPDVSVPLPLARRYQLEERLAAGAFGEVWRATDLLLSRAVAVKLLHASFARHPEILARFRSEAKNAGAVCHPNIAQVYDYGEPPDAPAPYLVMELVTGPSLQAAMEDGPLPPDRVMDIVAQVAAGLVHRDIKPGNLLLSRDGLVKITDFGISHAAGAAPVTRTGQLVGTPGYLAPERARGGQATPASDLYSLGIVAWECLAGEPPYTGDVLAVASAHRDQPLPPLPATVPAEVAELVAALTVKEPSLRPESAAAVAERAGQLRGPLEGPGLLADPAPEQAPPGSAQTRLLAATMPQILPSAEASDAGEAAQAAWAQARAGRRQPRPARRQAGPIAAAVSVAAAVLLIAGLVLAFALSPGRTPTRAGTGTTPRPGPTVLTVDAGSLIGQPVPVVVRHLEHLGLRVRLQWQPSAAEPPGTVLAVLPGGPVRKGSLVTVIGSVAPRHGPGPGQPPPGQKKPHPGHGKGHATASLAAAPGGQDGDGQGSSSAPPPASPPTAPTDTPSPSPDPTPIALP